MALLDFSTPRAYIRPVVAGRFTFIIVSAGLAGLSPDAADAQAAGAATVQQIPAKSRTADRLRVAPVTGRGSSSSVQEARRETPAPRVAPEVIAACRAAQAEDRRPPEGVDCMAAMQALAEAQPAAPTTTAESSLLELFGQSGSVTGGAETGSRSSVNADQVARQLSTGDVQPSSGTVAAGVAARERGAPPANPPR